MNHTVPSMFAKPSRVLLVEDDLRLQTAIRDALSSAATCELVAVCSSSREALRIIEGTPVDIALISLSLGDGSGLDVVQAVKQFQPHSEVLVMSTADDKEDLFLSLEVGATSCLVKEALLGRTGEQINPMIPSLLLSLIQNVDGGYEVERANVRFNDLSIVQRRILGCLLRGLSNKEIARDLILTSYNVDYHLKCLRKRFSVRNRAQLVGAAMSLLVN